MKLRKLAKKPTCSKNDFFERHFTLDRTWKGTDHAASLEFDTFKHMVDISRKVFVSLGSNEKKFLKSKSNGKESLKMYDDSREAFWFKPPDLLIIDDMFSIIFSNVIAPGEFTSPRTLTVYISFMLGSLNTEILSKLFKYTGFDGLSFIPIK